ncbi:type II secretion system protein N [Polymorphobacter fuscus]|nr:type II secretion system protein N [Polymorphobacter fuscus]NJC07113.1 general secretion pathway protein C [Polymorphobacter fuscus]
MAVSREHAFATTINVLECLVLGALAWQVARLGWTIATPAASLGDWTQPVNVPGAPDRTIVGSYDPFFRSAVDEGSAVSDLDLVLAGTRVDQVSGRGSAIIGTPDGVQSSYAVGELIQPGVTLTAVGFDSVTISRGGTTERLFVDQSAGAAPVTMPQASASSGGTTDEAGAALAADVTITPRRDGATITGYVLTPKGSGAAFAAAGLQPGDVLVSVDGATVTSLRDVAGLSQQLAGGGIDITVERNGRPATFRIGAK